MKTSLPLAALALVPLLTFANETVTVRSFADVAVYLERQSAASVESLDEITLAAELNARVVEVLGRPGDTVSAGDLLVRLDDREVRIRQQAAAARLAMAEATEDMARIRAERARRLAPDGFVSEDQLLEAETNLRLAAAELEAARSDLSQAELMLARTRIEAPFTGVVTRRLVGDGALAAPGTPLLELVSTGSIEVTANIPPEQVSGLLDAETLHFDAGGRSWPVRIDRIAEVVSRGSRGQMARLVFVAESAPPGSEGRIRWTDPRPALPGDFVLQRDGALGVLMLAEDGHTVVFRVLPGADAGRPYLAEDLAPETRLIDDGRRRVQPGQRVSVRSP
ncbi:MAG: efflux RND transporter periplasmic adaptor subunit [Wenzhouxiangella sp.]